VVDKSAREVDQLFSAEVNEWSHTSSVLMYLYDIYRDFTLDNVG